LKRSPTRTKRQTLRPVLATIGGAIVVFAGPSSSAQEALRSSLSYDQAVAPRQNEIVSLPPDQPHLGPVALTLGAYSGADFSDNINAASINPESDIILHDGVTTGFAWQATPQSSLNLNAGVGYVHYLKFSQNDRIELAPNSYLNWDIYFDDGSLTFYDQFTYSQSVVSQAALAGISSFPTYDNTAGIRASWLPGHWMFQAGYSHDEFFSDSTGFSNATSSQNLDRSSEYFFGRAAWRFAENTQAGVETSASITGYRVSTQPGSTSVSIGPYADWQVTQFITATLRGGPTYYFFDSTGSSGSSSTLPSYYVGLTVSHQLTPFISHSVSVQRDVSLGVNQGANYTENLTASYSASWAMTEHVSLSASASYVHGSQTFQNILNVAPGFAFLINQTEIYDQYSLSPGITWHATQKLSAGMSYSHSLRQSDLTGRGYAINSFSIRLSYAF
jgi:hypothetical protein